MFSQTSPPEGLTIVHSLVKSPSKFSRSGMRFVKSFIIVVIDLSLSVGFISISPFGSERVREITLEPSSNVIWGKETFTVSPGWIAVLMGMIWGVPLLTIDPTRKDVMAIVPAFWTRSSGTTLSSHWTGVGLTISFRTRSSWEVVITAILSL